MRIPALLVAVTLLAAAGAPPGAAAQTVSVEHVANVGDSTGGSGPIGSLTDLLVLDDGRILASDLRNSRVWLFDENGRFERAVGKVGQGPGDYGPGVVLVRGPDGAAEFFTAGRKIVHSPDLVDPVTLPMSPRMVTFDLTRVGDHYVQAQQLRTEASVGLPIHVFSREGDEFVRSFGADPPIRDVRNRSLFGRRFAASSDSTFWSADLLRFRLQHWTLGGTLLNEIIRTPEWFPPQEKTGIDPLLGPRPRVGAISHDSSSNVLWVATIVAREDWASAPTRAELFGPIGQPSADDQIDSDSAFRTIIEAIDPATGSVLARGGIEARVMGISRDRFAFAESRSPDGKPVVRVWRLSLQF